MYTVLFFIVCLYIFLEWSIVRGCRIVCNGNLRDFLRRQRPHSEHNTGDHSQGSSSRKSSEDSEGYLEPKTLEQKRSLIQTNSNASGDFGHKHMTMGMLVGFAHQVAKGMEYLAGKKVLIDYRLIGIE